MKKYICTLIIGALLFAIFSCKHENSSSLKIHSDSLEKLTVNPINAKIVNISSFVKDIRYWIPDSSIIIGNISKVEIHNDKYYIFDDKTQKLCVFDQNGRYIQQISKLGNGPGEYITCRDFTVSERNKEIYILDSTPNRILVFGLDGRFLKTIPIDIMGKEIYVYEDVFWVFTGGSDYYTKRKGKDYNLFKLSKEGTVVSSYQKYNEVYDSQSPLDALLNNNDNADFHYGINHNIYKLDSVISQVVAVDFGKYNLPYSEMTSENSIEYLNAGQYARVAKTVSSENIRYVNYIFKNRFYGFIEREGYPSINYSFLNNDIDDVSFALSIPFCIRDNKILYVKDMEQIFYNNKKSYINIKDVNNNVISITKDSNPVIAILTMHDEF